MTSIASFVNDWGMETERGGVIGLREIAAAAAIGIAWPTH
jgi:hypothetical protein